MLQIDCLKNNLHLRPNLSNYLEAVVWGLAATGKKPSIENVFNTMRESGVEIDIQTTVALYEEHIAKGNFDAKDPLFSKQKDLDIAKGRTFDKIRNKTHTILRKKEIGRDNPAVAVSASLASLIAPDVGSNPTIQKIMQDRLFKAAKRALDLKGIKPKGKDAFELVQEALSIEQPHMLAEFGYMENARVLLDGLKTEFMGLAHVAGQPYQDALIKDYANKLDNAVYSLMLSTPEVQKILRETLKEAGFTREVSGNTILDWKKVFAAQDPYNPDFREVLRKVFTDKGFTPQDVARIVQDLSTQFEDLTQEKRRKAVEARNKRATNTDVREQKTALDRLLDVYNEGIFRATQRDALLKVLGVTEATSAQLATVESMMRVFNKAQAHPVHRWSPTYMKTVQRELERVVEKIEEDTSGALKTFRFVGFYQQLQSAAILQNAQNILENILSGLNEYLITLVRNPAQAIEAGKIFTNVFKDVLLGGVREGQELSNAFNSSGNLEDRFNFETARTTKEKIWAAISFSQRVLLSAFDNSFKAGITHLLTVNTARKLLKRKGYSSDDANLIINEIYFGNRAELELVAKNLENNLKQLGIKVAGGKWRRIASELSAANLLENGQFFKKTVENLKLSGRLRDDLGGFSDNLVRSLRNAANSTASKGLGHEADMLLLMPLDDINRGFQDRIQKARSRRDIDALIKEEVLRNAYHSINRFRGGSLRWMWLSFQKASGISLLMTLIEETIRTKGKPWRSLNLDNVDLSSDLEGEMSTQLGRYLGLRQRLVRQTLIPAISYGVGYTVLLPALKEAFGGDDDDEAKAYAKLGAWINDDPARRRWFQKALPSAIYNYLDAQTNTVFGQTKPKKNPEAPTMLDVIDPTLAANALLTNFQPQALTRAAERLNRELNKDGGDIGPVLMETTMNVVNPTGFLRAYQLNKDAIAVLRGETTKLSEAQYDNIKPEHWWDAMMYSALDLKTYEALSGNERGKIAPINDEIIALFKKTNNKDYLPPSVEPSITVKKEKLELTRDEENEFVRMVEEERIKRVKNLMATPKWKVATTDERRIELLRLEYAEGRDRAVEEFLKKRKK